MQLRYKILLAALVILPMFSCVKPGMAAFRYGELARNAKSWDEAIVQYTKAIELDPTYGPAYFSRGQVYYHKLQYDKAIIDFSRAIEIEPSEPKYYFNRGKSYYQSDNYTTGNQGFYQDHRTGQ